MNLPKSIDNFFNTKIIYFILVFLAAINILGYISMSQWYGVIWLTLVYGIIYFVTENISFALFMGIIVTGVIMTSTTFRKEGFENELSNQDNEEQIPDQDISDGITEMKSSKSIKDAKEKIKNKNTESTPSSETFTNSNALTLDSASTKPKKSSNRIDYMTTLEDAYISLDKMLGKKGIEGLTNDTTKLMEQQQKLFKTMQQMTPMLETAQKMMNGLDLKSLGSLAGLGGGVLTGSDVK